MNEKSAEMISGSCHCGSVGFTVERKPDWLTECNCSICRRIGAKWAHFPIGDVRIEATQDATIAYAHGDRTLAVHTCRTCGCTPYWQSLDPEQNNRMAVNFRMCDPDDYLDIRVRHFDGADTWQYLD